MQVTEQFTMQVGEKELHHGKCEVPICSHACSPHAYHPKRHACSPHASTLRDMHARHTPLP